MRPLTLDDLLPLDEFARRRQEFFVSLKRYQDRYRKVRVGPQAALLFANRQTLWFQAQEVIRVARLSEPQLVAEQLDLYNRLLPGRNELQAALVLEPGHLLPPPENLGAWHDLQGEDVLLVAGPLSRAARLATCRPEDRCFGAVHWLHFDVDSNLRKALATPADPAHLLIQTRHYRQDSGPLSDDVRQSLLDDLTLSDRDA